MFMWMIMSWKNFTRIIAALTGLPKAWPARLRIVVHIQLCANTYVIGIESTRSTTTFWFVLAVSRISRNYIFSPDMFRALSFTIILEKLWQSWEEQGHSTTQNNNDSEKIAEKRKRGIEVEENRQSGGTFYWRKSAIQIRERWSSLTRTTMLNSTLRITTTQRRTNS